MPGTRSGERSPSGEAPRDSYAAAFQGGTTEAERRRLDLQAAMYGRLTTWTLDALGLAPGGRVADLGCGGGGLLPLLAEQSPSGGAPPYEVARQSSDDPRPNASRLGSKIDGSAGLANRR